ncbi:MAG: hypothetical protein ACI9RP_003014, partial [Cyclobacteriaceae bacterium]
QYTIDTDQEQSRWNRTRPTRNFSLNAKIMYSDIDHGNAINGAM